MADEALCYTNATELAALFRRRALSPLELMRAVLARIGRLEPRVNAFATLVAESALAAAKEISLLSSACVSPEEERAATEKIRRGAGSCGLRQTTCFLSISKPNLQNIKS